MRGAGNVAALVGLSIVAAVGATWPLVLYGTTAIPYGIRATEGAQGLVPGDHLQFLAALATARDGFVGRVAPFTDPYQFQWPGAEPRLVFFFLPFSLLFAAASPLGDALAYDLLLWASFPLTAVATWLLARRWGAHPAGALVAAMALTLLPYRVANLAGGHPSGLVWFLPILAYHQLERAVQERSRVSAFFAGLLLAMLTINEPHFAFFAGLLGPIWLGSVWWRLRDGGAPWAGAGAWSAAVILAAGPAMAAERWVVRHAGGEGGFLALLFLVAVFALAVRAFLAIASAWAADASVRWRRGWPLVLLGLYAVPFVGHVPRAGAALGLLTAAALAVENRDLVRGAGTALRVFAPLARLLPALAPGIAAAAALALLYKAGAIDASAAESGRALREVALFSPRLGDYAARGTTILSHLLYVGPLLPLLAVLSLRRASGRLLVAVAVVSGILALGPGAPDAMPLYPLAHRLLPLFDLIRQPAKLFAVVATTMALAAALGWSDATARIPRGRRLATAAVVAALAADFAFVAPLRLTVLPERTNEVYGAIAARRPAGPLLAIPLWPGDSAFSSLYQYWSTRIGLPMVNGYSPTVPSAYVDEIFRKLEGLNAGDLTQAQHARLRELGVGHLILHADAFPPKVSAFPYRVTLDRMRQNPNLNVLGSDDAVHGFVLADSPYREWRASLPRGAIAFFEGEHLPRGTGAVVAAGDLSGEAGVTGPHGDLPVWFGPYRPFPPGRYVARFRVRGDGTVDVAVDRGARKLAVLDVSEPDWAETTLAFGMDEAAAIELRGFAARGATLGLDWVQVAGDDGGGEAPVEGPWSVEAEMLRAVSGRDVELAEASGGSAAEIVPGAAAPGTAVREGPWIVSAAGRWTVVVRHRGEALGMTVESADGRDVFARAALDAADEWKESTVPVVLPRRSVVELVPRSAGGAAWIDWLRWESAE